MSEPSAESTEGLGGLADGAGNRPKSRCRSTQRESAVRAPDRPYRRSVSLLQRRHLGLLLILLVALVGALSAPARASADAYSDAVMANDPYAFWKLGDQPGATTSPDTSGNGHPLTYQSGVTLGTPGPLVVLGGTAASSNGTVVGTSATMFGSSMPFTVEGWVRLPVDGGGGYLVDWGGNAGLRVNSDGSVSTSYYGCVSGTATLSTSSGVIVPGVWALVDWTISNSGQTLYVNGKPITSGSAAISMCPNSSFHLGTNLKGAVADVALYRSVLSGDAVAAHWTAASQCNCSMSYPPAYARVGQAAAWQPTASGTAGAAFTVSPSLPLGVVPDHVVPV